MEVALQECISFMMAYEEIKKIKMNLRVAYKINKIFKEVEENVKFYYEQLNLILEEYGERDENGELIPIENGMAYKIKKDKIKESNEKILALQKMVVTINSEKIELDELDQLDLTLEQASGVFPFLN